MEMFQLLNMFRYNNYLGRFHWRHIDMMDVLAGYQMRSVAPLDDIARLCGLPGKLDVDGGQVQDMWFAKEAADRVCVMDDGLIIEEGTPEQIFDSPTTERAQQFLQKI